MKILGVTQGASVRVFARIVDMLAQTEPHIDAAAYVADSLAFKVNAAREQRLKDGSLALLKEWDITAAGRRRQVDWQTLNRWEQQIGDPSLWHVLLADRRIFFGKACKFRQDYAPRFTHAEMSGILLEAIERVAKFLDHETPDVIVGFGTATFGDYLFYRFAKAQGIPYLSLKATKIANYVSLNDDAIELSNHVASYLRSDAAPSAGAMEEARRHMAAIRDKGVRYEGALKSWARLRPGRGMVALARGLVRDLRNLLDPEVRRDNHVESAFVHSWYTHFRQPLVGHYVHARLGKVWVGTDELSTHDPFVFFPLHFEPEVSIQVFGRPYQNQIELVRNLALALPPGMCVLVKEHPRSIGFRPYAYYRKLLEIPNVRLVEPRLSTHAVIRHAQMVAVISGSTGLEAAICGKPVLTFGCPTYNVLPQSIVRQVRDIYRLGIDVRELLESRESAESEIQRFLAAHVDGAVPVDLYSVLLGKPGRHSEGREELSADQKRADDYLALARYFRERLADVVGN